MSIHAGWVTRIAQQLADIAAARAHDILVTNAFTNGCTTRQALERMSYEVQTHGVDILIVQFGLNDCNYWLTDHGLPRVSSAAFAANLIEIVMRGRTFGAQHIFLNTNHPTTRNQELFPNTSITFEQSNRQYNQIIRDVAAGMADFVSLNDVEAVFDEATGTDSERLEPLLMDDGLHPGRSGHDLYFAAIADKIRECVKRQLVVNKSG